MFSFNHRSMCDMNYRISEHSLRDLRHGPGSVPAHPPVHIQTKCPCRTVIPHCSGSKWAAADQYQPQCQHNRGFSNAEPEDEKGVGSYILVGPVALTRLLSYSFLEAAKSWALEIAIPQKGRYICSTCGHIEVSEKLQTSESMNAIILIHS